MDLKILLSNVKVKVDLMKGKVIDFVELPRVWFKMISLLISFKTCRTYINIKGLFRNTVNRYGINNPIYILE